jgi:hypothetical protein
MKARTFHSLSFCGAVSFCAAVAFAACGGEQTPAATPSEPTTSLPLSTPSATAAPAESVASASPSAAPADSAAPDAGAPKPAVTSGGRPPVLKTDDQSISDTFGASPAKLQLGDSKGYATLKIPEGALDKGYNITFQIDPKAKAGGQVLGKIYHLKTQVAGAGDLSKLDSVASPFELQMPAGNKKDANLAIGELVTDEKGNQKLKWTVIAPKSIDDATNIAFFELPSLGADTLLHVTTRAPTDKK